MNTMLNNQHFINLMTATWMWQLDSLMHLSHCMEWFLSDILLCEAVSAHCVHLSIPLNGNTMEDLYFKECQNWHYIAHVLVHTDIVTAFQLFSMYTKAVEFILIMIILIFIPWIAGEQQHYFISLLTVNREKEDVILFAYINNPANVFAVKSDSEIKLYVVYTITDGSHILHM